MPEHMLVSEMDHRVEVIGDAGRRRYWPAKAGKAPKHGD